MAGDWVVELADEIDAALAKDGPSIISVPNAARQELAISALERRRPGYDRKQIQVVLVGAE